MFITISQYNLFGAKPTSVIAIRIFILKVKQQLKDTIF